MVLLVLTICELLGVYLVWLCLFGTGGVQFDNSTYSPNYQPPEISTPLNAQHTSIQSFHIGAR